MMEVAGATVDSAAASSRFCRIWDLMCSLTNVLLQGLESFRGSIVFGEDDEVL